MSGKKSQLVRGLEANSQRQKRMAATPLVVHSFGPDCSGHRSVDVVSSTIYYPLTAGSKFTIEVSDQNGIPNTGGHHCLKSSAPGFQSDFPSGVEVGLGVPRALASGNIEYDVTVIDVVCACD